MSRRISPNPAPKSLREAAAMASTAMTAMGVAAFFAGAIALGLLGIGYFFN